MVEGIDLLLVNPNNRIIGEFSGIEPPLWAGLIASHFRKEKSVAILDAEALNLSIPETVERIKDYNPEQILIVVMGTNPSASSTPKMPITKELINALGDMDIMVTGLHPSALPEQTERELGKKVLTDKLFSGTPPVAWDLLPMDKYRAHNWHCLDGSPRQPYGVIYTSLGCPFHCSFCNIHALYGKHCIEYRPPDEVVQEIDLLITKYQIRNIKIWDELFALNQDHVITICDLIIDRGYNLNMWAYARVDTINEYMLNKMRKAGIKWVGYGIESANEIVRGGVTKKFEQARIIKAVKMAHEADINVMGNFIFGLPDDTFGTMRETLNFAKELLCEYVNFYVAMPYPGSQLYTEAVANGTKLPKTWDAYSQYGIKTSPLPTLYLQPKEIIKFRDNAFVEYFSNPKYISMIGRKFGGYAVTHIREMVQQKIR